ncbi:hypothetical protein [Streptomyces sp. MI02-7b]|uniref:hypothetical protein n=1 Tax=Streptomyces sp. MI02-7b TaxID=462941 RepID=UPI0029A76242|nr:hypothetical protein [Streptomyces sp. MI02-7b]MDX3075848.1 hypothetical protein [Streptomyces sp. MI02-7b]
MTSNDTTTADLLAAASTLLQDFRAGSWLPTPAECDLAEGLAHARWSEHTVRAQLRDQPDIVTNGPLGQVFTTTVHALASPGTNAAALLTLRVLVDALAPPLAGQA